MMARFDPDLAHPGLIRRFVGDAGDHSWGRFYLAVLCVDSNDSMDQAIFASLLRRAWDAGGFHLKLHAIQAAQFFCLSNARPEELASRSKPSAS